MKMIINSNQLKFITSFLFAVTAVLISSASHAKLLDRVVAVVENDVIMESELRQRVSYT